MIHLHVKDKRVHRYVRLVTVDNDTGEEVEHPLLYTGYLPWGPNKRGYTIMATYLSSTQDCPPGGGTWRLLLFSDAKITAPLIKYDCNILTRYGGLYFPNKYLRLFRDVLTTTTYPLAVRLTVTDPTIHLYLRVYHEKTSQLVAEVHGRRFLHLPCLGLDQIEENEKKYILEVVLDEKKMPLPPSFTSPRPYYFSHALPKTQPDALLEWNMEVVSATPVVLIHDQSDLQRFAKVRSGWEASQPGRAERAKKAREMCLKVVNNGESGSGGDGGGGMMITAPQRVEVLTFLNAEKETGRMNYRSQLPPPTITIHEEREDTKRLLPSEELSARLSEQQSMVEASNAKVVTDAQERKEAIQVLQEEISGQCKQVEEMWDGACKRREQVWSQRETYRKAHVARLAQEAAALAAFLAPPPTTKKR